MDRDKTIIIVELRGPFRQRRVHLPDEIAGQSTFVEIYDPWFPAVAQLTSVCATTALVVKQYTQPTGIGNLRKIKTSDFLSFDKQLCDWRKLLDISTGLMTDAWEDHLKSQATKLGPLFQASWYPTPKDFRNSFQIKIKVLGAETSVYEAVIRNKTPEDDHLKYFGSEERKPL